MCFHGVHFVAASRGRTIEHVLLSGNSALLDEMSLQTLHEELTRQHAAHVRQRASQRDEDADAVAEEGEDDEATPTAAPDSAQADAAQSDAAQVNGQQQGDAETPMDVDQPGKIPKTNDRATNISCWVATPSSFWLTTSASHTTQSLFPQAIPPPRQQRSRSPRRRRSRSQSRRRCRDSASSSSWTGCGRRWGAASPSSPAPPTTTPSSCCSPPSRPSSSCTQVRYGGRVVDLDTS